MSLATEQKYVTNVFSNILFRTPTDIALPAAQTAINTSANQIFTGAATEAQVAIAASQSGEAAAYVVPIVSLYEGLYHRAPDVAGLAAWAAYARTGASLNSIATAFAGSPEFTATYGVAPTASAFLTNLYTNVLGRTPDTTGYNAWLAYLGGGTPSVTLPTVAQMATVALAFTQSAEGLSHWTTNSQNWLYAGITGAYPSNIGPITYTLTNGGTNSATEASIVTFHLSTINVAPGALLAYTITGVTAAQILGHQLTGTTPVAADGTANIPVTLSPGAGQGLTGTLTLTLTAPPGAGAGSVTIASVSLTETPVVYDPIGTSYDSVLNVVGGTPPVVDGLTSHSTINFTASQALQTVDQVGSAASDSLIINFNAVGLTVGTLNLGNGSTNSDPGTVTVNNNAITGVSTISNLVDNATVKGMTTLTIVDASGGSNTIIGAISDTALRTIDASATTGTLTIGNGTPLAQNGLIIKLGTGTDTVSIHEAAPSQVNADLISNFVGTKDTLNLGTSNVLTAADFQNAGFNVVPGNIVNGFDTKGGESVATFLSNLGNGNGTAGVAAFNDGTNTWLASVSATGLTDVAELVGVNTLTSIAGANGGTGGLNLSTLGGTTAALAAGGNTLGTAGNDTFTALVSDGGVNTLNSANILNGNGGADTLVISPAIVAAVTLADNLWTNVSNVGNIVLKPVGGVIDLFAGAHFNTAFSTGINLTATTDLAHAGAINITMDGVVAHGDVNSTLFTGPANITAIALGAGAETIYTGSGLTTVNAYDNGAAITISGQNITAVTATNPTTAGAMAITSTGTAPFTVNATGGAGKTISATNSTGIDIINATTTTGATSVISTGSGNDIITLTPTGAGAITTITAGSGADVINLGSHGGLGLDHLVDNLGASGTFAAPATNSISTATFDVVTGMQTSDTLQTAGPAASAIVTGNDLSAALYANDSATVIRGTYTAGTKTFVGSLAGADALLVVDTTSGIGTTLEATVIVAITGFASHAANIFVA